MLSCDIFLRFNWPIRDWPWMTFFPVFPHWSTSRNLDVLRSFEFPSYILLKMYVYIHVHEMIIFCVDFRTRRDMCKTTTIFCSVMSSIDFAPTFLVKKKALVMTSAPKKVHFPWSFILSAQDTLGWKLESTCKLTCFTCFASQQY